MLLSCLALAVTLANPPPQVPLGTVITPAICEEMGVVWGSPTATDYDKAQMATWCCAACWPFPKVCPGYQGATERAAKCER